MTGTGSLTERTSSKSDTKDMVEVGLSGLGAHLSNTQLFESEMSSDPSTKMSEEPVEIDMGDEEAFAELEESSHSTRNPELSEALKHKERTRSRSPQKTDGQPPRS